MAAMLSIIATPTAISSGTCTIIARPTRPSP
jgi:hypothetical protein